MNPNVIYDILIVGCGPAGLSAAINATIRQKKILIFGSDSCLAKIQKAPIIDNYLGFHKIKGDDLRNEYLNHVQGLGITIQNIRIDGLYPAGDVFQALIKGEIYSTRSIIITTGLAVSKNLPGEQKLLGKGVGYCATCDGPLYKGKKVIVLGENKEAQEEANFLADICESVIYIPSHNQVLDKLKSKVKLGEGKPLAIVGEEHFTALQTDKDLIKADGLFIIREVTPIKEILSGLTFEKNYIKVQRNMATNIRGVFAAGDCTGPPYQIAKSVGEGQVAALSAVKYLDDLDLKREKENKR